MIRSAPKLVALLAAAAFGVAACDDPTDSVGENTDPEAVATVSPAAVVVGSDVTVDATGSSDADGDDLTFTWSLVSVPSGSSASLSGADTNQATFTTDAVGTYSARLVVSDGTASDTTVVDVQATNSAPLAVATPSETVAAGSVVDLDGTGSSDGDVSHTLAYSWTLEVPAGSGATLSDPAAVSPSFTTDEEGEYRAILTVTDGFAESVDTAVISALTASAPPSITQTGTEGHIAFGVPHTVFVEATDPEGAALEYEWSLVDGPGGLDFRDDASDSDTTDISVSEPGTYLVQVAVSDALNTVVDTLEFEAHDAVLDADITAAETFWPLLNAEYSVTREVNITAAVTVEPGATFRFESGAALDVGGSAGSLSAVGTAQQMIRFLGATENPGFWRGIRVATNNPANELTFVEVAHAGSSDFGTTGIESNVHVDAPGRLAVSNSWIHAGGGLGLAADNGATLTFGNNRFGGNTNAGVRVGAQVLGMLDAATIYDDPDDPNGAPWIGVWDADVESDATWPAPSVPYLFEDETNIQAAVTIDPGAMLLFQAGAGLDVTSGSLAAVGTASEVIVFEGQTDVPGHWRGIRFQSNNAVNELTHVRVSHGGENDFGTTGIRSNVHMDGSAQLRVTNSSFTAGAGNGLFIDNSATLAAFSDNHFAGNGDEGLALGAEVVGSLDTGTDYNADADTNGEAGIRVLPSDVQGDATWPATNAPLTFEGETNIGSAVQIQPGAVLWFTFGSGLDVTSGSLSAVGTETDTITMLGTTPTPGHWRGIRFATNDPANELTYVDIAHGGEDDFGTTGVESNVHLDGSAQVTITFSTFRESSNVGLYLEDGNNVPAFASNRFAGNAAAGLKLAASQVSSLDTVTEYDDPSHPNGEGYIDVYGETVDEDGVWKATGDTPYRFTGETDIAAAIEVQPGAELWFASGAGLDVPSGSLNAIGTGAQPIVFRGEVATVGYWRGIRIHTNDPLNVFDWVEVYHGGADDFGTTGVLANLHVDAPGQLTLSNSTFDMSDGWDAFKDASATVDDSGGGNAYLSGGKNF